MIYLFFIKEKIKFADQDVMNILFASYPEWVFDLPCQWNLKKENCETKNVSVKTLNKIEQFLSIRITDDII